MNRRVLFALALTLLLGASAFAANGGPDASGIIWSDEAAYEWIDTAGSQSFTLGDDEFMWLPLDFAFNFYGIDYTGLWAVSNGYLIFTEEQNTYVNQCPLPDAAEPNGAIYFYWHDLIPPAGGITSRKSFGEAPYRHFLVTYENVAFFGSEEYLSAQVLLTETVDWVQIFYLSAGEGGSTATIGVENQDGTIGLAALCDETELDDETSLFFGRPGAQDLRTRSDRAGLVVEWDDPSGAESFLVETSPVSENNWTSLGNTTQTQMSVPGAQECDSARYRVTAFAGDLGRAAPAESTLTYFPIAPSALAVANIDGAENRLAWRDNSGCEDSYIVERREGLGAFSLAASLAAGSTTWTDEGAPESGVTYRVKAASGLIASDYSEEEGVGAVLMTADDLVASPYSDTKILLTWTDASTDESGWRIERRGADETDDSFAVVATLGPDGAEYLDFDLAPETGYAYRVTPFTLEFVGNSSNTATAETWPADTPPADDDSADDDSDDDAGSTDDDERDNGGCGW